MTRLAGASSGDVALTGRELTVHVYTPVRGPHAEQAYTFLRKVWARWRSTFGADVPISAFGLPDLPPASHIEIVGNGPVAAQESSGPGVCQTILRREHDVLCLSGMIAPPPSDGVTWADLDRGWTRVCGAVPEGLLGVARLYLAKIDDGGQGWVVATPQLARSWRQDLPAAPAVHDFDGRGVTTRAGFAVWEVGFRFRLAAAFDFAGHAVVVPVEAPGPPGLAAPDARDFAGGAEGEWWPSDGHGHCRLPSVGVKVGPWYLKTPVKSP